MERVREYAVRNLRQPFEPLRFAGAELRIAGDGEILVRGRHVMKG